MEIGKCMYDKDLLTKITVQLVIGDLNLPEIFTKFNEKDLLTCSIQIHTYCKNTYYCRFLCLQTSELIFLVEVHLDTCLVTP